MGRTVAELPENVQCLLNELQNEIPLEERPYRTLGEKVGLGEAEAVEWIGKLKQERLLRQVSAIFDTRSLGYQSSLVAVKTPPGRAAAVAKVLNEHPGVSHNYERRHAFNIWFTIAVPEGSSLEEHTGVLRKESGAESIRLLPTLHLFKIGMKIDATGGRQGAGQAPIYSEKNRHRERPPLSGRDKDYIRALQVDMEVRPDPFQPVVEALGTSPAELFAWCRNFQTQGRLRRVAGILNHRRAGFRANGMGVWKVPGERVQEVGLRFAQESAVTHCYLRPTYPDWPYNIFTMVHGAKVQRCETLLEKMSRESGVPEYATLYSVREYKKIRLSYFTGEIARWEETHGLKPGVDA